MTTIHWLETITAIYISGYLISYFVPAYFGINWKRTWDGWNNPPLESVLIFWPILFPIWILITLVFSMEGLHSKVLNDAILRKERKEKLKMRVASMPTRHYNENELSEAEQEVEQMLKEQSR